MKLPETAERYLERLRENLGEEVHRRTLSSPHLPLLIRLLEFSPYAGNLLCTREDVLNPFLTPRPLRVPGYRELEGLVRRELSPGIDFRQAARVLRAIKQREVLKILALDLSGAPFELTVRRISRLAEVLLREGLRYLASGAGLPLESLLVLAFGKLGGRELNYASDIDLAYFHHQDLPKVEAIRIFEQLTRLLDALVDGDRVWRVDLRLRPGGKESELSLPLNYAREYYLYRIHPFERLALVRARPVAGNLRAGYRLLAELRPVIYPRYLDFAYLEHIRDLKERIRREARRKKAEDDLKIGEGGLREVEFLVQALQSIYGGKHPELRTRRVLAGLRRLARLGILPAEEARSLREAYLFLRTVEHRIQTRYFQQTFRLPRETTALRVLAASLGFSHEETFLERLAEIRRRVSQAFSAFLTPACPKEKSEVLSELREALLSGEGLSRLSACTALPEHLLLELHRKLRAAGPVNVRRAEFLRDLLLPLLEAVLSSEAPDKALARSLTFFERLGGRFALFSALREHPERFKRLIRLFTLSEYLWRLLEAQPGLAEAFFEPEIFSETEELRRRLGTLPYDEALSYLRIFKNETLVAVGAAHLEGRMKVENVLSRLTRVAEAFVRLTYEITLRRLEEDLKRRLPGNFAVLALGKLGAREMGYRSDLDLVFVYEGPGEMAYLSAKLAQRFLSYLSLKLPEGEGYPVDARLRPEGRKGPLTVPLSGLIHYYHKEADPWELVAAARMRFLAGDRVLGRRVEGEIRRILAHRAPLGRERHRLFEMRLYMERERGGEEAGRFNPKLGRGALADLEFLAALVRLKTLKEEPDFSETHTPELLKGLPEGEGLRKNYYFLREVAERLILLYDPLEEDPVYAREQLEALEKWLGPNLCRRYEEITAYNRKIFEKYFRV